MKMHDITIRSTRPADDVALARLAALDSQPLPAGELIVAELAGELVAAYSPETDRVVADPFRPTAALVGLLRLRAADAPVTRRTRRGLFDAIPRLA